MRELGWSEWSIRKGRRELASGLVCVDAFDLRGRRPVEARLPKLSDDIRAIVDAQSQTDPQFRTRRLYTRLSVEEVRRQLIAQKGYTNENCPCYRLRKQAHIWRSWAAIKKAPHEPFFTDGVTVQPS
jgi:hypothetical protein